MKVCLSVNEMSRCLEWSYTFHWWHVPVAVLALYLAAAFVAAAWTCLIWLLAPRMF